MRKIKRIFFLISLLSILLAGCNNSSAVVNSKNNNNEQFNMMKDTIVRLEKELNEKDKRIQEIERKVESNWINLSQKENEIYMLDQLVKHLPNIIQKEGYIKEVVEEDKEFFLLIDYAKMIHNDGYSPNNFHIENQKEDYIKVEAVNDVQIYFRDGTLTQGPWQITNELFDKETKRYQRFFDFYFIDNKLVLVVERYLP